MSKYLSSFVNTHVPPMVLDDRDEPVPRPRKRPCAEVAISFRAFQGQSAWTWHPGCACSRGRSARLLERQRDLPRQLHDERSAHADLGVAFDRAAVALDE